jgi:hypothetical protein
MQIRAPPLPPYLVYAALPQQRRHTTAQGSHPCTVAGARSNQWRPVIRGWGGDLAEICQGWWEPGSHGVGAGALLLVRRRPVVQGASEPAGGRVVLSVA